MEKFNLWINGKYSKSFRSLKAAVNTAIDAQANGMSEDRYTVSGDDSGLRYFQLPGERQGRHMEAN